MYEIMLIGIHLGKPGENGPIVFTMFKYDPPKNEVSEFGTITADKLEGPTKGKSVYDMALVGSSGSLYMNIHTVENPNGEIRVHLLFRHSIALIITIYDIS